MSNPVPGDTAPAQHPAVGDRYTCQTDTGARTVTVTRVCTPPDGGPVAIEFEWAEGKRTNGCALRLGVFTGTYARVCNAPGPDSHTCDLRAGHTGSHEELGYGRLAIWADEPAVDDDAARERQADDALPPTLAALRDAIFATPDLTLAEAEASARRLLAAHARELGAMLEADDACHWPAHRDYYRSLFDRYADNLDPAAAGGEQA
ncbi:hypothetical protein ACWERV_17155 [Streptomyces sp. NPDC004031]